MKKFSLFYLSFFVVFIFSSCSTQREMGSTSSKTYAEISVKVEGEWKDRKYEGGTFQNISSLIVPKQHTDHSYYIRYEGPGWESNIIGYRLYLDWRNAIDIFGKLTEERILPQVGQDGFDSYHQMQPWGADILKVGKGLGIGSIGRIVNNEVLHFNEVEQTLVKVHNQKSKSKVQVQYNGWKTNNQVTNLISVLSIFPNDRITEHTIQTSEKLDGICTGIVNLYQLPLIQKIPENGTWAYAATYGKQTLFDDNLGMAIFYKVSNVEKVFTGKHDHLIQFKPTNKKITFYFLGAWEKEPNAFKNENEFFEYLNQKLLQLNANNTL
jgi:hypothetical protein